jgi:endogenous inhibitor of DNA gyrase (YacG/DUF329 family)
MTNKTTPKTIIAICDNCAKTWNYTGKNKVYVTCPDCRKLVKIGESEEEDGQS